MNLPDHWYVLAETKELKTDRPNGLRRHGREWVVWRASDGRWLMQSDRCPHRSARLSQGKIQHDRLACPFHGFQFDSAGQCAFVPETGREAPGLKVETHLLHEAHGFLWWKKGRVNAASPPWFGDFTGGSWGTHDVHQWRQHVSRCIENQLDYAHLPFVHATTIGGKFDARKTVKFLGSEAGIDMIFEADQEPGIRFLYPGLWRLRILPKMHAFIAFVAVDEETTRMYLRTYQSLVTVAGLRGAAGWVMKFFNRRVLRQDLAVVLGQTPQNVRQINEASREVLFPSDEGVRLFRRWLTPGTT